MKTKSSSVTARATLGALFFIISIALIVFAFATTGSHSAPIRRGAIKRLQAPIVLLPSPPPDPGPKLGFENFEGPGIITNVTTSSQGQPVNTVEYVAHDAGEPSIGVNWNSPAP